MNFEKDGFDKSFARNQDVFDFDNRKSSLATRKTGSSQSKLKPKATFTTIGKSLARAVEIASPNPGRSSSGSVSRNVPVRWEHARPSNAMNKNSSKFSIWRIVFEEIWILAKDERRVRISLQFYISASNIRSDCMVLFWNTGTMQNSNKSWPPDFWILRILADGERRIRISFQFLSQLSTGYLWQLVRKSREFDTR